MSVLVDRKPERAVQAKIKDIENEKRIYSRWIENPKGRSRQKLGISKDLKEKYSEESNDYVEHEFEKVPRLRNVDFCH